MGDTMTRVYRKGVLEAEGFPVADVSDYLEEPDTVVWVDFCAPDEGTARRARSELGLHELAVEDALGPHQRPKLDRYATHLFLSCHAVRVEHDSGRLDETEIDAFINERWLITVRKDDGFSIEPVLERWDRSPDLAAHGVSFLLYGLLDVVVDGYFDAVQAFDDYYDEVSDGIFADQPLDPARAAALVRDAPRPGPLPSPRRPHARSGQRPHAPRARRRLRRAVPVLPGRLRPHPAGQRVHRLAPRPRQHDRRDQPQPARLPTRTRS